MTDQVAEIAAGRALARADRDEARRAAPRGAAEAPAPIDTFALLDAYAGGVTDEAPRLDAIATISAGYRERDESGKPGAPRRSTDGRIFLHDPMKRAPALAAALERGGGKRLTIAFPFDDPRLFVMQRFVAYSATALLAYGDERALRVIENGAPVEYPAGTSRYAEWVAKCKVSVSVYFTLAEWQESGPAVVFGDGLGFYRLRFTSRHSLRSLVGSMKYVARFTRGRLAGVPFDLSLDYREVADGTGAKRRVPVWVIVMRPPREFTLSSRNFGSVMGGALAQGAALMLPAPSAETLELAAAEGPEPDLDEPTEEEMARMGAPDRADRGPWAARYHAAAKGTYWETDRGRGEFLERYTGGERSLAAFLASASNEEAEGLIAALKVLVAEDPKGEQWAAAAREGAAASGDGVCDACGRVVAASALESDGEAYVCPDCLGVEDDQAPQEDPERDAELMQGEPPAEAEGSAAIRARAAAARGALDALVMQATPEQRARSASGGMLRSVNAALARDLQMGEELADEFLDALWRPHSAEARLSAAQARALALWAATPGAADGARAILEAARGDAVDAAEAELAAEREEVDTAGGDYDPL